MLLLHNNFVIFCTCTISASRILDDVPNRGGIGLGAVANSSEGTGLSLLLSFIIICLTIAQGVHRMPESSSFQGLSHLSWRIISFLRKSASCSRGYKQFLLFAPAIEYFIPIRSRRILRIQLHSSCHTFLHVYSLIPHPSLLPLSCSSNRAFQDLHSLIHSTTPNN